MKQRISPDDLKQLTPSQQEKLRELLEPKNGDICYWEHWGGVETAIRKVSEFQGEILLDIVFNDGFALACKKDCLPLLSIGQCIELLNNKYKNTWSTLEIVRMNQRGFNEIEDFMDALWNEVKSIL